MRIILASTNRGKYREISEQLLPYGINLLFGGDFENPLSVEETGTSYIENALLKAKAWATSAKFPSLADDSGLEVDALDGAPGVRSARVMSGSDYDRIRWLLNAMVNQQNRRARFVCSIAVVFPERAKPLTTTSYCYGQIAHEPRGDSGFGYDPVFIPDGFDKTFAELSSDIKNKISHRAMAVKSIAEILLSVVQSYAVRGK